MISFCVAILSFSWTTGTATDPAPISDSGAIGPRIGITAVFLLGLCYFYRVSKTLSKYGDPLPRHWALHSPPPLAAQDGGPGRDIPDLDLEGAQGIALGTVKDMADRAQAMADRAQAAETAETSWAERGRGLIRGWTEPRPR